MILGLGTPADSAAIESAISGGLATAVAVIAMIAAVASAIYSKRAIDTARKDSRLKATLETLTELNLKTLDLFGLEIQTQRNQVLEETKAGQGLSPNSVKFLAFMNSLNMLAFAAENELVERKIVEQFVRNLADQSDFLFGFIREYRDCCNDKLAYRFAFSFLLDLRLLSTQGASIP